MAIQSLANIHTRLAIGSAVPLVLGLLRLAPVSGLYLILVLFCIISAEIA